MVAKPQVGMERPGVCVPFRQQLAEHVSSKTLPGHCLPARAAGTYCQPAGQPLHSPCHTAFTARPANQHACLALRRLPAGAPEISGVVPV